MGSIKTSLCLIVLQTCSMVFVLSKWLWLDITCAVLMAISSYLLHHFASRVDHSPARIYNPDRR